MAAFNGTDPNGAWVLSVKDLDVGATGTLNSWSLDLRTGTAAPPASPAVNVNGAGGTVPEAPGDGDLTRTVNVSGAGPYLTDVDLLTNISHVIDPSELRVTLTSPAGTTVVITKPTLNLAFFDTRPLATFEAHAPRVTTWAVGGHSLGGVRACQLAKDADGLLLLGSYCANDISRSYIQVLSVSGSRDGLSTPAKVDAARHLLPSTATMVEVQGSNHEIGRAHV